MPSTDCIIINGNEFVFEPGETVLQVAQRNDIDIPTLCHLKGAAPSGKCRTCVVEVKETETSEQTLMEACMLKASPHMIVWTESAAAINERRMIIKRFLMSGNHNCAVRGSNDSDWTTFQLRVQQEDASSELCPVWGDCRLQDLAYRYQVTGTDFSSAKPSYPMETANPFIIRDFSRCILCGRCVQACNEIQVNKAILFGEGKLDQKIVTPQDKALKDSDCVFCGECVQVCPVGALVEKDARYSVRPWETRQTRTTCSYCGVGCQIDLHVKDNRIVKVTGAEDVPPNFGSVCVKGRFGFDFIHSPDRLTKPLVKENGRLREAGWDEALALVADRFSDIKEQFGGDSIGVLTSARISNEENYVAQKFTRGVLKTNNIDHCARL